MNVFFRRIAGAMVLGAIVLACGAAAPAKPSLNDAGTDTALYFDGVLRNDTALHAARLVAPGGMLQILSMLQAGASGTTRDALSSALGGDLAALPAQSWHKYLSMPPDVRQGNALWLATGLHSNDRFTTFASTIGMQVESFAPGSGELQRSVTHWLDTIGVPNAPVTVSDRIVVLGLNVLAVDAKWKDPFNPHLSSTATFTAPTRTENLTFMHREGSYRYLRTGDVQLVDLPYTDGLSMWLGLQSSGTPDLPVFLRAVAQSATTPQFGSIALPRLKIHTHVEFADLLANTKLGVLFTNDADLRGMTGQRLPISQLFQDISLSVDEAGTKVVAVTGVATTMALRMPGFTLNFDRPFAFAIVNDATGALLLTGVVLDPAAS